MPKKFKVEVTHQAETDINDIFDYSRQDKPSAALNWANEIETQIEALEYFPYSCPIIPESQDFNVEYRQIILGNYRTVFLIEDSIVYILRVIHCARLLSTDAFESWS